MLLTDREKAVKDIMFDIFIPALHKVITDRNPEEYKRWHGNCCKQTAIFGAYILKILLPDYEWTTWDGVFSDKHKGEDVRYNHAWILGKEPSTNRRLLIDLARTTKERLFREVSGNRFPKDHPEYKDMVEESRERLDWEKMIEEDDEFYTGLPSRTFIEVLRGNMMGIALQKGGKFNV